MGDVASGVVGRLTAVDTGLLSDALDRLGLDGVVEGLGRVAGGRRLAASVVTVCLGPTDGRPPGPHLGAAALAALEPGRALVVANDGRMGAGAWGGLLTRCGRSRGLAGVVVDGAVRDVDEIEELGVPVFARGSTPRSARGRWVELEWGVPVNVAGVRVEPGDYVVADGTGVVTVARDRVEEVLAVAESLADREARMAERLEAGEDPTSVLGAEYERMTDGRG